jgi:hypothetical protein
MQLKKAFLAAIAVSAASAFSWAGYQRGAVAAQSGEDPLTTTTRGNAQLLSEASWKAVDALSDAFEHISEPSGAAVKSPPGIDGGITAKKGTFRSLD